MEKKVEPVTEKRILIALCQMMILKDHGKDIERCDDYSLIREISDYEKIPAEWPIRNYDY